MANLQIIKELAKKSNVTLEQLAKELEITPQALSKIMRENSTKVATLERIAQLLKVSVTVFFPEEIPAFASDHSVAVAGSNNNVDSTNQTTYGDNSPAVKGNNNHFGGCASVDKAFADIDKALSSIDRSFDEAASQRLLTERTLALLEKRDAQIDRLIDLLQTQLTKS